ncbi:Outer membrane efflux protein [Hymenobacter daecheongensis DSM 21074]|uniref:Outer membrane efflux protein n=1 Tax=Hymenobacter daecheongensis DSM 21074 TaxID=1121955 RepID=A0A1M6L7I3_9BACT|nr:TolC family protein [Hymenobacter daecheongensis]SHJ66989.1 Outer membrane efflux protein [Hymenobacter daecheongensis DSM 21074]
MKQLFLVFLALSGLAPAAFGQANTTLPAVIGLALGQSVAARQAVASRETSHWQYRAYQAAYRPQLALQGTLPNYSRVISAVVQPDGTTDFRAVRINNANAGLTLTQAIGPTGAQLFVTSAVQRFDDFNRRARLYNNQPVGLGLTQPLGRYNALRWNRLIEPLRYQEAGRQYVEERENIAQRVTELYFDVLLQQVNADVARQNVRANEEMYRLGQERFRLGRLSENDLLLLELNLLNSRRALAQARLDAESAALSLQSYTGLPAETLVLAVPAAPPALVVSPEQALAQARQNRREPLTFRRRLLQAESDVALAKGVTGFQATLQANLGYVNSAPDFWTTYNSPQNQQQVSLAFALPLVDWGRQKAVVKTAELSRRQTQHAVAQEQATFEQTVALQAAQLGSLHAQLGLAAQADSLAQRRYAITQATYKVGRISLTDLNIALAEKDQSKRAYVAALRAAWVAHYRLRALTLYDFERQEGLK